MTLRYLTSGESHGPGLTAILEGLPKGLSLTLGDIHHELKRRQKGYGRGHRMNIESDEVEILSGVRHGQTLGSPIALWVENKDHKVWQDEMSVSALKDFESQKKVSAPRPGHGDLAGGLKYNEHDLRNILERASARETCARVALGAIAKKFLLEFNIDFVSHVQQIGRVQNKANPLNFDDLKKAVLNSNVHCFDELASQKMAEEIDEAKAKKDTLGGLFEVRIKGVPVGLGSHTHWDLKLDAQLAYALMSIPAIKGVSFGLGFNVAEKWGSKAHDAIDYQNATRSFHHRTNLAGGFTAGITTGEELIMQCAMKPLSTLYNPLDSVNVVTKQPERATIERSDTCAVPAAAVVAENIAALVIASAFLKKFSGDTLDEVKAAYKNYSLALENY